MRKKARFHSLKKIQIRQDWSKWTLYNLSRLTTPSTATKTYFQQKWAAKSATRAYHGEQVREKQWKRLFRRNIPAVVPMDHKYLARNDGSEQAAGRGAGADTEGKPRQTPQTPYMPMVYYPLERRLDVAIFRALFASSTRQARQFVVHGLVKVNGKKMVYPGYMLNPGDLFQVSPDRVMWATGARKRTSTASRKRRRAIAKLPKKKSRDTKTTPASRVPLLSESSSSVKANSNPEVRIPKPTELKKRLLALVEQADAAIKEDKDVKAKDKQKLREFRKEVKKAISVWKKSADLNEVNTLEAQLAFLKSRYTSFPSPTTSTDTEGLTRDQENQLSEAFNRLRLQAEAEANENPLDPSAPYATPWRPRDYMSAFAFIPRYLEVNQNVCAAVYLRHPVARPGLAEVPTPFHFETSQLAFNWYLRRR